MNRYLFVIVFWGIFIIFSNCTSKEPPVPDKIFLSQKFETGKTYQFVVERTLYDSRKKAEENTTTHTDIVLQVKNIQDSLILCTWKYGNSRIYKQKDITIYGGAEPPETVQDSYKDFTIRLLLTKDGAIHEILNKNECRSLIKQIVEKSTFDKMNELGSEGVEKLLSLLKTTYENDETLFSTYFPELPLYFSYLGTEMHKDSVYTSESYISHPFFGTPIKSVSCTKIDTIKNNIVRIISEEKLSEEDLERSIKEMGAGISKNKKKYSEKAIPEITTKINSYCYYHLREKRITEMLFEKAMFTSELSYQNMVKIRFK